ncbi:MAG: hypothetical protein JNM17_35840 [Archangium sp.]|nr:hypothetical protein [Archangium sp.]
MALGPLVVMTRAKGQRGWTVRIDPSSIRVEDTVITAQPDGRLLLERAHANRSFTYPGYPFAAGAFDVVGFLAKQEHQRPPTPRVMRAIEAVRAADSEDARRVLSDVLEESGSLPEAEYVRLELKLQAARDTSDATFVEGVRQLRVLSSVVGPTFRYLVGRDIDGCSGVRWAFRCPASWDEMKTTAKADERVCTSCRQMVVQVTSEAEASRLAAEGVCAQVRLEEEPWVGELAAPEPGDVPQWVGSVAVRPPMPEPTPPVVVSPPEKKPWWRRLFGR